MYARRASYATNVLGRCSENGYIRTEPHAKSIRGQMAEGGSFDIKTDYSRFRVPFSKAYVMKRPHEIRKDWKKQGYKGILVGINEVDYTVWVPELSAEVQSSNVIIDESTQGELESGEMYPEITEKEKEDLVKKSYTIEDFEHLRGTEHIDNEDGLKYKMLYIRRHRRRNVYSIVVDRKCSLGGVVDTIYALDARALTVASSIDGHKAAEAQSAAAASVPESLASVGTVQREVGKLSRDSLLARASEMGDFALVHKGSRYHHQQQEETEMGVDIKQLPYLLLYLRVS